jgi:hypothetical protein
MAVIVGNVEGEPTNSVAEEIEKAGGTEKEYFFEGTATGYRLADQATEYPTDGRWRGEPAGEQPFRSRMVVLSPADRTQFNGTVIVEWNNVSSGENFILSHSAPQLIKDGFAVVGVSAQFVGVEGLPDAPQLGATALKSANPERYASLHHPSDDYSYDIFHQAGQLLGPGRPHDPDPLAGLEVRHLIAMGASQSSARLAGYLNGIHAVTSVYDAFLLVVYPNTPTALNAASAPTDLPQTFGPNQFHLLEWYKHLLRDDLDVPIIVLNSESEASECHPNSQPDTELLRWWEIAGTSHTGMASTDILETMGVGTSVSFGPAVRAALHALARWLDSSEPPQHQPRLLKHGTPPRFRRDEHGNAIDGIQLPDVAAPLATHAAERIEGDGSNLLRGSSIPFTAEQVRALYPDHATWFATYKAAVEHLTQTGVVLPDDGEAMVAQAQARPLPA